MIPSNAIALIMAELILGVYILVPWGDPQLKGYSIVALIALLGGHLNGVQGQPKTSQ